MAKRRGGADRDRLGRRRATREPRRRILVLCEGSVTEPGYFRSLRAAFRNSLVEVEIEGHGEVPWTVVQRACERKKVAEREARRQEDDFLAYDEVWCVFDVDDHAHLHDARQQARDNGVELAVSNPCFELWPLLHFQEQNATLDRRRLRTRLKAHLPTYEKALPFARLHPAYGQAVRRAAELERRCEHDGCPGANPSTGVHRLTESIRAGGRT